jgi:hypothetical protein
VFAWYTSYPVGVVDAVVVDVSTTTTTGGDLGRAAVVGGVDPPIASALVLLASKIDAESALASSSRLTGVPRSR